MSKSAFYIGAPNTANLQVAPAIDRLGLNLLKIKVGRADIYTIRNYVQPGYDSYRANIPAYMRSFATETAENIQAEGFPFAMMPNDYIPICPPPVILYWSRPVAEEILAGIREKYPTYDATLRRGSGLVVKTDNWVDFATLKQYKSDMTCQAADEIINPASMSASGLVVKLATQFLRTQVYPAVHDSDHFGALMKSFGLEKNTPTAPMDVGDSEGGSTSAPLPTTEEIRSNGRKLTIPKEFAWMFIKYKGDKSKVVLKEGWASTVSVLPQDDGLYFPYVTELAHYDNQIVPDVIQEFFFKSLGHDLAAQHDIMTNVRSAFGIIGQTEFGKQMSHVYLCIRMAINAQARPVIILQNGALQGVVLSGSAFTLSYFREEYHPVPWDILRGGILDTSGHFTTLIKIYSVARAAVPKNEDMPGDMLELMEIVNNWSLTEAERRDIEGLSGRLRFGAASWGINSGTLVKALSTIATTTDWKALSHDLPIHPTMIFTFSVEKLVWSCFGDFAPTFLIPGGTRMELQQSWNGRSETVVEGGKQVQKVRDRVTKIAVRNVALEQALKDLAIVRREKYILNPMVERKAARRSQYNMDRFFTGAEYTQIAGALRACCDVTLGVGAGPNKRQRDEESEGAGPSKRLAIFDF